MNTYQHHISELKHSSQLPEAIEELNAYWHDEQARRRKFLEEMDEETKAEFIEGELVLHSPAKEKHNAVVQALTMLISTFVEMGGLGIVRIEKAMLHLARNNFEPDVVYWSAKKAATVKADTILYPVPDWVCEVLSASTSKRDRGVKLRDYAANGIKEYWIIDPDKQQLEQYLLQGTGYELALKSKTGTVESIAIEGLSFDIEAMFNVQARLTAIQEFFEQEIMPLTHDIIRQRLTEKFGPETVGFEESYGMLAATVPAKETLKVLQFLYDDEALGFRFLTAICAVHYPDRAGEELCVVYHLHNLVDNVRLRIKAYVPVKQPDIFTAVNLFPGANWMERETYDYFGVNFIGHPNLTRILNVDEMDYFPMRKEFPMEDASRRDKDDEMFGRGGSTFY